MTDELLDEIERNINEMEERRRKRTREKLENSKLIAIKIHENFSEINIDSVAGSYPGKPEDLHSESELIFKTISELIKFHDEISTLLDKQTKRDISYEKNQLTKWKGEVSSHKSVLSSISESESETIGTIRARLEHRVEDIQNLTIFEYAEEIRNW